MPANRYAVYLDNANQAGNPAIVDFELDSTSGVTDAQAAAQIAAYILSMQYLATGSSIQQIRVVHAGSAGSVLVPWPATEYAAIAATNVGIPAYAGYGTSIGSGGLTPVGTSALVMEYSAIPGRSTTGRHYLPFVSEALVDGAGRVAAALLSAAHDIYDDYILNTGGAAPPVVGLEPLIVSKKLGTDTPVTAVVPQRNYANLRSRRS